MVKIAPSILSADFANLEKDIRSVEAGGADYLHLDVMDGIFVSNISIGVPVIASVRKITKMPLDVHLMITTPLHLIKAFLDAGADMLTFHLEADSEENNFKALELIKSIGVKAGLSLKPKTPVEALLPYIDLLDLVLIMSVEPGFGGQSFMHDQLTKMSALRKLIDKRGLSCEIEVDGGINSETAKLCVAAGVDVLVSGNTIFKAPDRAAAIRELRGY